MIRYKSGSGTSVKFTWSSVHPRVSAVRFITLSLGWPLVELKIVSREEISAVE